MSISENNQQPFKFKNLRVPVPPCNYEEVVLYYQETAKIYYKPTICGGNVGEISGKKIYKEGDI